MTRTSSATSTGTPPEARQEGPGEPPAPSLRGWSLWFAVLGGIVAWGVHLGVAWSVTEVSCFGPLDGEILQQGGRSATAGWVVVGATVLPWLVAVAALVSCVLLRRRLRHLDADVLAQGRVGLLLVLGLFLDLMAIAAITGGGIGLAVLDPCG